MALKPRVEAVSNEPKEAGTRRFVRTIIGVIRFLLERALGLFGVCLVPPKCLKQGAPPPAIGAGPRAWKHETLLSCLLVLRATTGLGRQRRQAGDKRTG